MARVLDDWIEAYLKYTEHTEPRETFREWVAISTLSSALQRKCSFDIGFEIFYPNMYIVLVGPPASRKGTAMKPGREFLNKLGIPLAADETSRQKLITKMMSCIGSGNNPLDLHSSLTIHSSELTVFLGYNNDELLAMLCKWFDCESKFIYDTHTRGEEEIINVWVNLLGATTPKLIQSSLPEASIGSGFTSRTIFVYEDDKNKTVVWPRRDKELEEKLLIDLEHINAMYGEYKMDDEFKKTYERWYIQSEKNPPFKSSSLDYYLQRRQVHLIKLCMIFSASRSDNMILRKYDFARALTTLERVERNMPRVFEGVGKNPLAEVQTRVIREIATKKKVYVGELMDMFYNDITQRQLAEILATLVERRFCKWDQVKKLIIHTPKKKEKEDEPSGNDSNGTNSSGEDNGRGPENG